MGADNEATLGRMLRAFEANSHVAEQALLCMYNLAVQAEYALLLGTSDALDTVLRVLRANDRQPPVVLAALRLLQRLCAQGSVREVLHSACG